MTDTPRLALGELIAAQSQKHVTVNEALTKLDALVDCYLTSMALTAPPASSADGDAYLVATGGTGAWANYDGKIAYCIGGAWIFYAPFKGLRAHNAADGKDYFYTGAVWQEVSVGKIGGYSATMTGAGTLATTDTAQTISGTKTITATPTFNNATYSALFTGGPVGFGTSNPAYPVDLYANANAYFITRLRNANAGSGALTELYFLNDLAGTSGAGAGIFLNSSGRTTDGGASGFGLFNDYGGVRIRSSGGDLVLATDAYPGINRITIQNGTGNVGIGIISPTEKLTVAGNICHTTDNTYSFGTASNRGSYLFLAQNTPASATASGSPGQIAADASYIYVCTAANTWKRAVLATW